MKYTDHPELYQRLVLEVTKETHSLLKKICAMEEVTIKEFILDAIKIKMEFLKKNDYFKYLNYVGDK